MQSLITSDHTWAEGVGPPLLGVGAACLWPRYACWRLASLRVGAVAVPCATHQRKSVGRLRLLHCCCCCCACLYRCRPDLHAATEVPVLLSPHLSPLLWVHGGAVAKAWAPGATQQAGGRR